jgi:antitoxin (DNA-binding transcriptional repressor) of toxin-antitoxin stability system
MEVSAEPAATDARWPARPLIEDDWKVLFRWLAEPSPTFEGSPAVQASDELVITDRGAAVARLVPVEGGRKLDRLIAEGVVTPAAKRGRIRPSQRVKAKGTVSDLVAEQRR